ncbi:MAG: molybdate ABC transporter substrate-binding protein [Acidobacteriota bacterium]
MRTGRKLLLLFVIAMLMLASCSRSGGPAAPADDELTVSAAISLKDAFDEIGGLYTQKTGRKIVFNYGASGVLQKQIASGAPIDVFASAGDKQMNELSANGLILESTRRDFAGNRLVLIVPRNSQFDLSRFEDLGNEQINKIAVANPATVPAGQYTNELFAKKGLIESLRSKLILAENVRQVLDYVIRDEVDAGIVYQTDAKAAGDSVRVCAFSTADDHDPIRYPIAVVAGSGSAGTAADFVEVVSSPEGRNILQKYGFDGPPKN